MCSSDLFPSHDMEQMHQMLQHVSESMENRELAIKQFEAQVKAFQAETQRIAAVQESMTAEQISDIVHGTIAAALDSGDLIGNMPEQSSLGVGDEPNFSPEPV